eukprot:RCo054878
MAPKNRISPMADIRKPGLSKGIAGGAVLLWFVTFVISIISTSIPDWWWWLDSTSGVHEGLWSTCWAHYCIPSNGYTGGCMSLLNVVRAFSVMTIIFGFFCFVCSLMMVFCIVKAVYPGLIFGFFAWTSALITWAVYLGFKGQCVMGSQFFIPPEFLNPYPETYYYPVTGTVGVKITLGSGWCLAVAAFPIGLAAHLMDILWFIKCRKRCVCACPRPCPPPPAPPPCELPEPIVVPVPVPICCSPPPGAVRLGCCDQPDPCGECCCQCPCQDCCTPPLPAYECCEPLPAMGCCGEDYPRSSSPFGPTDPSALITA